jgi:Cell wall synthesis protein CwsA
MSIDSDTRLTPAKRLTRGLAHTAAGPVDVTRGTAGLLAQSVAATVDGLRAQYRKNKARRELRKELAAAQEFVGRELSEVRDAVQGAVQALPQTLSDAGAELRKSRRRTLVIAGAGVLLLAGGAAAFAKVRRSGRPEPSPLPPSVAVAPKP